MSQAPNMPNMSNAEAGLRDEGAPTQLLVEQQGPVVILTISNPPMRNALGPEVYRGLGEIAARAREDKSIRAVILTGADGVFCGGGNLNRIRNNQSKSREYQANGIDILHGAVRQIRACPVPFIAAVEGAAAGAGFSIAMQCDMIFAAEDAKFTMAYVKSGLTPDGGGSAMLGHHDRMGLTDTSEAKSWNSSHPSKACDMESLKATGGAGLMYCFAS